MGGDERLCARCRVGRRGGRDLAQALAFISSYEKFTAAARRPQALYRSDGCGTFNLSCLAGLSSRSAVAFFVGGPMNNSTIPGTSLPICAFWKLASRPIRSKPPPSRDPEFWTAFDFGDDGVASSWALRAVNTLSAELEPRVQTGRSRLSTATVASVPCQPLLP